MDEGFRLFDTLRKALIGAGLAAGTECMGGACEIGAAEIALRRPFAVEGLRRHARAIGAGCGAEHPGERRAASARSGEFVPRVVLAERGNRAGSLIEQRNL